MVAYQYRFLNRNLLLEDKARDEFYLMPGKHMHPEIEIYFLTHGNGYIYVDGNTYEVAEGDLVIFNSEQVHQADFSDCNYHRRLLLEIDADFLDTYSLSINSFSVKDFFRENAGIFHLEKKSHHYKHVLNGFTRMIDETTNKSSYFETMLYFEVLQLLIFLQRTSSELTFTKFEISEGYSGIVKKAIDFINTNLHTPLSLETIAKELHVNKSYLSRIFKSTTSANLHEYLNIQRVRKAQILLTTTEKEISEISELIGFNSVTYFQRIFKKHTGTTPNKYSNQHSLIKSRLNAQDHI